MKIRRIPEFFMIPGFLNHRSNPWMVGKYELVNEYSLSNQNPNKLFCHAFIVALSYVYTLKVVTEMRGMKGITNITNQKLQQIISTTKHSVMTSALLFLGRSTIG